MRNFKNEFEQNKNISQYYKGEFVISKYYHNDFFVQLAPFQVWYIYFTKMKWFETLAENANKKICLQLKKFKKKTPKTGKDSFKIGRLDKRHMLMHHLCWGYMGVNPKSSYEKHWDKENGTPKIQQVCSRDVWLHIHKLICSYDPMMPQLEILRRAEKDNGFKLRFLTKAFNEASQYFFHLPRVISIDDIMKACYCRTNLARRVKTKPSPVGLRFWGASSKFGYLHAIYLDCNYTQQQCEEYRKYINRSGPSVVMFMCQELNLYDKNVGTHLYIDNWFNHVLLQYYLRSRGIFATGTLHQSFQFKPENSAIDASTGKQLAKGKFNVFKASINSDSNLKVHNYFKTQCGSIDVFLYPIHDSKIFYLATNNALGAKSSLPTKAAIKATAKKEVQKQKQLDIKMQEYQSKTREQLASLVREREAGIGIRNRKCDFIDALLKQDEAVFDFNLEVSTSASGSTNASNSNSNSNDNNNNNAINVDIMEIELIENLVPGTLTAKELKMQCRLRGISQSGNKATLEERIINHDSPSRKDIVNTKLQEGPTVSLFLVFYCSKTNIKPSIHSIITGDDKVSS